MSDTRERCDRRTMQFGNPYVLHRLSHQQTRADRNHFLQDLLKFPSSSSRSLLVVHVECRLNLVSRHFRDEQVGAAVGSYESVYGIGSALGPTLAGTVAVMSEARFSFVTASLFAILMTIIVAGKTYPES